MLRGGNDQGGIFRPYYDPYSRPGEQDLAREPRGVRRLRHAETAAPEHYHGAESDNGLGARGRRQVEVRGTAGRRRRSDPPPIPQDHDPPESESSPVLGD